MHNEELGKLAQELGEEKTKQTELKKQREKFMKQNQKLKQQTGIVNKKELKQDYDARDIEIKQLQDRIKELQEKHMKLTRIIE